MRKLFLLVAAFACCWFTKGQGNEWLDPTVNEVNRMPMHANYFAYESRDAAIEGKREISERFISLNGKWNFHWVKDADKRPTDFFRTDYNDSSWGTIPVPGVWEVNGYGNPLYVNNGYPWRNQSKVDPPYISTENNNVGSYRRVIEIPAGWNGRQVIAHFGSVTSNMYLWVNGKYVGYSEDSKLEAEFDITPYIRTGENLIAFQVFRWCDGLYLEDQDFLRLSGVGRDCYIYSRDHRNIEQVELNARLEDNFTSGVLDVNLDFSKSSQGLKAVVEILDRSGQKIAAGEITSNSREGAKTSIEAGKVLPWSAEQPNLYKVIISLQDKSGNVVESIPVNVGFRNVEIKNAQLLVNGQPILFKGINRHELDPTTAYYLPEERMLQDIKVMKEFNINAVRTCHYPDDNRWYKLCDEYGIYVIAEANIESHGMGYGERTLAKNDLFAKAHMERNIRNVRRSINHPSVITWSLGNEAGNGPNFVAAYEWIKDYDPTRPVQYEQAHDGDNTDVRCPMYASYEWCERYLNNNPTKPLIQCEYAHAMGNSMGGFKEYWDMIREYPSFQGGYIWDFSDQAIRMVSPDGISYYGYGGDFNRYDASDGNFMCNGMFSPDRNPNPHAFEVQYYYQSIWTRDNGVKDGKVKVYNEYFFRDLSNYRLDWTILHNGIPVKTGTINDLNVAPQSETAYDLGFSLAALPADGELLLNVEYKLKSALPFLPAGFTEARQQFVLREFENPVLAAETVMADTRNNAGSVVIKENNRNYLIVSSPNFFVEFNKRNGYLTKYNVEGIEYMENGTVLEPNFWRAATDNDYGANLQRKYAAWNNPRIELKSLNSELVDNIAVITAQYEIEAVSSRLNLTYRINNIGEILVEQALITDPAAEVSEMYRFGMRMQMPQEFDMVDFYGRGPIENYADRNNTTFLGVYSQTVSEQFYPYIRPQENGLKTDIRWWRQSNADGYGLRLVAAEPFSVSALNYSQESLDSGWHKQERLHSEFVEKADHVYLCIDKVHMGLACVNSWGAIPLPQYCIPYQDYTFTFMLSPVRELR